MLARYRFWLLSCRVRIRMSSTIVRRLCPILPLMVCRLLVPACRDVRPGRLTLLKLFAASNRKKLASNEPKLVTNLIGLMESSSLKVQCQAALALRNLASDGTIRWCFNSRVFCARFHLVKSHRSDLWNSFPARKIPDRDCQKRRSCTAATSPPICLPSAHPFRCRLRSERFYPP